MTTTEYDYENRGNEKTMKYTVTTNGSNLNLRAEPSVDSAIIGSLKNGTVISHPNTITTEWVYIKDGDTLKYLASYYLIGEDGNRAYPTIPTSKIPATNPGTEITPTSKDSIVNETTDNGTESTTGQQKPNWLKIGLITFGCGCGMYALKQFFKE